MDIDLRRALELLVEDNPDVTDDDLSVMRELLNRFSAFDCIASPEPKGNYELRWQPNPNEVLGNLTWYTKDTHGTITTDLENVRNELSKMAALISRIYEFEVGNYPVEVTEAYRCGDNLTVVIGRIATFLEAYDNLSYFSVVRFDDTVLTIINRKTCWTVRGMVPAVVPVVGASFSESLNLYHGIARSLPSCPGDDWVKMAEKNIKRLQRNYNRRATK